MGELVIPNYPDAESRVMRIGEYWYDEVSNEVFTFRTMLHPVLSGSNYKIIYPEVSRFNTDNPNLTLVYPRNDSLYQTLSGYSFLGTSQQINITEVEEPHVSYNKQTKTFVLTFLGKDIGGYKYLFTYYLKRKDESLVTHNTDCIKPDLDILNVTFTDWERLSGEFNFTGSVKPYFPGDLINFETALTASYGTLSSVSACQTNLLSNSADEFSTGQIQALYVGDRNDGMNTIWLGCSSVEYLPGLKYPFPVMYNTTYALPQQKFNTNSDIEVYVQLATYSPQLGLSNRAIYSAPALGPVSGWTTDANGDLLLSGSWGTFLTAFTAVNSSGLDPSYAPGNGFCIFFYNPDDTLQWPEEKFAPYNNTFEGLSSYSYPGSGFMPAGVGESLGWKPYQGLIQLSATGTTGIPTSACPNLTAQGMQSGYLAVGFDVAGGFATNVLTGSWSTASSGLPISATATSSVPQSIVIAAGRWDDYSDYVVTPPLPTISQSIGYEHLPNRTLCQKLTGVRETTLEFPIYRVTLEDCCRTIRVAIKDHGADVDNYIEYASYTVPDSTRLDALNLSALKVGFAFSTSDKTMTCEIKSINTYGRDVKNPIYKTECGTKCTPTSLSSTSTDVCPVSVEYDYLRAEGALTPIVTEGHPLSTFGLNYIVEDIYNSLYYGTDLGGDEPKP